VASNSIEKIKKFLSNPTDRELVGGLCTSDVTYVSLNYSNPELQKSMPWCGTYHGSEAIVSTFERVNSYWKVNDFSPDAIFGDDSRVAVFGSMTLTSTVMKKTVTTPFSIFCKMTDGKISYMQFMEDTFATSSSFRSGGLWEFRSDPAGSQVSV
jgi:ketosteroid isomerase-like protein